MYIYISLHVALKHTVLICLRAQTYTIFWICAVGCYIFQPCYACYWREHCWPRYVYISTKRVYNKVLSHIDDNLIHIAVAGDAVVNVYINHEKKFAFVEMRSVEEASNAMALDGIIFEVF